MTAHIQSINTDKRIEAAASGKNRLPMMIAFYPGKGPSGSALRVNVQPYSFRERDVEVIIRDDQAGSENGFLDYVPNDRIAIAY